jgi:hypothetical protein
MKFLHPGKIQVTRKMRMDMARAHDPECNEKGCHEGKDKN